MGTAVGPRLYFRGGKVGFEVNPDMSTSVVRSLSTATLVNLLLPIETPGTDGIPYVAVYSHRSTCLP